MFCGSDEDEPLTSPSIVPAVVAAAAAATVGLGGSAEATQLVPLLAAAVILPVVAPDPLLPAAVLAASALAAAVAPAAAQQTVLPAVVLAAAVVDPKAAPIVAVTAAAVAVALALSDSSSSDSDSDDDKEGRITAEAGLSASSYAALMEFMMPGAGGTSDAFTDAFSGAGTDGGVVGSGSQYVSSNEKGNSVIEATMLRLEQDSLAAAAVRLALPKIVPQELEVTDTDCAVDALRREGVVRLGGALSSELCELCLEHIEASLHAAASDSGRDTSGNGGPASGFGNVYSRDCRFDMYLRNEGVVNTSLAQIMAGPVGNLLRGLFDGAPCAFHELSALVSDSGSGSQLIHPDSKFTEHPILYTCFVALQDVAVEMGPTLFLPRTNNRESHNASIQTERSKAELLDNADYRHALLRKGEVTVMDSRTLHCGTANRSGETERGARRRVLLYFTVRSPLHCMTGPVSSAKKGDDEEDEDCYPVGGSLHPGLSISTADFI